MYECCDVLHSLTGKFSRKTNYCPFCFAVGELPAFHRVLAELMKLHSTYGGLRAFVVLIAEQMCRDIVKYCLPFIGFKYNEVVVFVSHCATLFIADFFLRSTLSEKRLAAFRQSRALVIKPLYIVMYERRWVIRKERR